MAKNTKITEHRILQISQDIANNTCTATAPELVQVAHYWMEGQLKAVKRHKAHTLEVTVKLLEGVTGITAALAKLKGEE